MNFKEALSQEEIIWDNNDSGAEIIATKIKKESHIGDHARFDHSSQSWKWSISEDLITESDMNDSDWRIQVISQSVVTE